MTMRCHIGCIRVLLCHGLPHGRAARFDGGANSGFPNQDYAVEPKTIVGLWQKRKLSHDKTIRDLHACRGSHCRALVEQVRYHEQQEKQERWEAEKQELVLKLQQTMRPFISHDVVVKWKKWYGPEFYGILKRFPVLLLRGPSQLGKTSFAESVFGESVTLTVQCQGLGDDLPSLREFDRDVHQCIVFDEISHEQVVNNKALFQAGKNIVELSQSKCGGFRYAIFPYQVAMICCSNAFPMTVPEGVQLSADADWLQHNLVVAELAAGQTWYVPSFSVSSGLPVATKH